MKMDLLSDLPLPRKAVLVVAIAALVAGVAFLAPVCTGPELEVGLDGEPSAVVKGMHVELTVPVKVDTGLPYDVGGVSLCITLVDPEGGSTAKLIDAGPFDVPSGGPTTFVLENSICPTILYRMLKDVSERDSPTLAFEVSASCGAIGGLASAKADALLVLPLTEDGERLGFLVAEDTDERFAVELRNLSPGIVPDDRTAVLTDGENRVEAGVCTSAGATTFYISSEGGIDEALTSMAVDGADLIYDGETRRMSGGFVESTRDLVDAIREAIRWKRIRRMAYPARC